MPLSTSTQRHMLLSQLHSTSPPHDLNTNFIPQEKPIEFYFASGITVAGTRIGPAEIERDHPVWGTSDGFRGLVEP